MTKTSEPLGAVYRFYDEAGTLLYVGRTARLPERFGTHRREKPWWPKVATIKLEWMPVDDLHNAEMNAIRTEKPKHNIAMTHRARRTYMPEQRGKAGAIRTLAEHFYSIGNEADARAVLNLDELDRLALVAGLDRRQMIQRIVAEYLDCHGMLS